MTPSQQMYLRLMGRKAISSSLKYRSLKPAPIKDRVLGIFSNETSEVRCGWVGMMLEWGSKYRTPDLRAIYLFADVLS